MAEELIVAAASPYWRWFESVFWILVLVLVLIIAYFIIKEIRLMTNTRRLAEIDLEKEKLNLMKAEMAQRGTPFFRVSPEQMKEIQVLDDENAGLATDIFAKHSRSEEHTSELQS